MEKNRKYERKTTGPKDPRDLAREILHRGEFICAGWALQDSMRGYAPLGLPLYNPEVIREAQRWVN